MTQEISVSERLSYEAQIRNLFSWTNDEGDKKTKLQAIVGNGFNQNNIFRVILKEGHGIGPVEIDDLKEILQLDTIFALDGRVNIWLRVSGSKGVSA